MRLEQRMIGGAGIAVGLVWACLTESSEFQFGDIARSIIVTLALLSALAARVILFRKKWKDWKNDKNRL
jgi:hypothetical protein